MRQVMVRYRVKPDQGETNAELVRAVFAELAESGATNLRYATFRLEDGVSFVHVAIEEGDGLKLTDLPAFQRFQEGIRDRCDEPPVVSGAEIVGSHRFIAGGAG